MTNTKFLLATGIVTLFVLAADQATKAIAKSRIEPGQVIDVADPLNLTLTYNNGIAFGIASGAGPLPILLALVAFVGLGFFIASAPHGFPAALAGGCVLGGALGNLVDRLLGGEVVDFVQVAAWPVFNLADVAITLGVVALAAIIISGNRAR